jgi:hypothetical protein
VPINVDAMRRECGFAAEMLPLSATQQALCRVPAAASEQAGMSFAS